MKRQLKRICVVKKPTSLTSLSALHSDQPWMQRVLSDERVNVAHTEHTISCHTVLSHLDKIASGGDAEVCVRTLPQFTPADASWADLIVSLGGDGTFLRASHSIMPEVNTPILAINTSPSTSYGFFCTTLTPEHTFPALWTNLNNGKIECKPLWRMRVSVNDQLLPSLVLNDVLFGALCAAETAKYVACWENVCQIQRSSGVWVCTAAGSTAATLAAGGRVQPLFNNQLQFRVRELHTLSVHTPSGSSPPSGIYRNFHSVRTPIVGGIFQEGFTLECRMPRARLYLDGTHNTFDVHFGDTVSFRPSHRPLNWLVPHDVHTRRQELCSMMEASHLDRESPPSECPPQEKD